MARQKGFKQHTTTNIGPTSSSSSKMNPSVQRVLVIVQVLDDSNAYVQPCYSWHESKWERLDWPDSVKVVWPERSAELEVKSLWVVQLEQVTTFDSDNPHLEVDRSDDHDNTRSSQYRVSDQVNPKEVFELLVERESLVRVRERQPRKTEMKPLQSLSTKFLNEDAYIEEKYEDIENIRRIFFDEGKTLDFTPCHSVYVGIMNQFVIGPFPLRADGKTGKWLLQCEPTNVEIKQYPTKDCIQLVVIDGVNRIILKQQNPTIRTICSVDCRSDSVFFDNVISGFSQSDELVGFIKDAVVQLPEHASLNLAYRRKRLMSLFESYTATGELSESVRRDILAFPEIKSLVQTELDDLRSKLELSIATELETSTNHVRCLQKDIDRLETTKIVIEDRIIELRNERQRHVSSTETDRTRELESIVAALIASGQDSSSRSTENVNFPPTVYSPIVASENGVIAEESDAIRYFKKYLEANGINTDACEVFLAALLAKRIPIIVGSAATRFLHGAGRYLFGGYCLFRTISPFTSEWSDLFGKFTNVSFRPDTDRLSDLLLTVDINRVHMVVFDGFNRCDVGSVFSRILTSNLNGQSVLHPKSIPLDNPYHQLGVIEWPSMCIPVFKYSSDGMQVPTRMWAECVTVNATFSSAKEAEVKPLFVTPTYLEELRSTARRKVSHAESIISNLDQSVNDELSHFDTGIVPFVAALVSLGVSEADLWNVVIRSRAGNLLNQSGIKCEGDLAELVTYCNDRLRES